MGKKIFFVSLVVLSLAMAQHWFLNRPKPAKKVRPRAAVRIEDLQLQDPLQQPSDTEGATASATGDAASGTPRVSVASDSLVPASGTESAVASASPSVASESAGLPEDPILAFFAQPHRTPFEPSPFLKLISELRQTSTSPSGGPGDKGGPVVTVKTKPTQLFAAQFVGTIQTDKELVAIVEKNLYRQGETFQGMLIKQIASSHMVMENDLGVFVLPKHGVSVQIASGEVVEVTDNFFQNGGRMP